jgi:hypothetical protein
MVRAALYEAANVLLSRINTVLKTQTLSPSGRFKAGEGRFGS